MMRALVAAALDRCTYTLTVCMDGYRPCIVENRPPKGTPLIVRRQHAFLARHCFLATRCAADCAQAVDIVCVKKSRAKRGSLCVILSL
jgi:hypothetical protein